MTAINTKLNEFLNDVEGLKNDSNSTQNEIWGNQLRQFLNTTDISQLDMKDFERLIGNMRYSSDFKNYNSMHLFLKLLMRNNLSEKKLTSNLLEGIRPIQVNPTKRTQSIQGYPSTMSREVNFQSIADSLKTNTKSKTNQKSNKIFIVHGQDEVSKLTLESRLRDMGLEPIILHKQANKGKTVIEKFEEYADDVNFAFVLFTPDDVGGKMDDPDDLKTRSRQNVILEFGYFIAKLGRSRVCCLYKKGVELPTDMAGLVYVPFTTTPDDNLGDIRKELEAAGYKLK